MNVFKYLFIDRKRAQDQENTSVTSNLNGKDLTLYRERERIFDKKCGRKGSQGPNTRELKVIDA